MLLQNTSVILSKASKRNLRKRICVLQKKQKLKSLLVQSPM
ncbi:22760_t:CDS:1, partial [Racocetra persica]